MRHLTVLLVLLATACSYNVNDCKSDADCKKVRADLVCDTAHDLCVQKACATDSDCASVGSGIVCDATSKLCVVSKNPTCQNACPSAGATQCTSQVTMVEVCQTQGNGCLGWSAPQECAGGESCSNGKCGGGGCTNACQSASQTQCDPNGGGVDACKLQSDGCYGWSAPVACPNGLTCQGGQCVNGCTNVCSQGATLCASNGTGVETCTMQATGCTAWSAAVACPNGEPCTNNACGSSSGCTSNADCASTPAQPVCNTTTKTCVACVSDANCGTGQTCVNGQCTTPCTNTCSSANATQCSPDGSGVETCQQQSNGCLAWSGESACPAGQTCSGGQCAPTCTPQCSGKVCGPDGCGGTCGTCSGGDGGTGGETCSGGQCVSSCTNVCSQGATQCAQDSSGNPVGVETCTQQSNGCFAWSTAVACSTGQTCSGGQCVSSCTNVCSQGATLCASNGTGVETCTMQATGCTAWSAAVACPSGDTCQNNQCACTSACSTPGATQCASGNTETETCTKQSNGCFDWNVTPCLSGQTCATSSSASSACVCSPGMGDCDGNAANGCETNLMTSASSCGTCGHSCGTGTCQHGQCQPIAIDSVYGPLAGIALENGQVYWVTTYYSGSMLGSPANHSLAYFSSGQPVAMTAGSTSAYWIAASPATPASTSIVSAPLGGGAAKAIVPGIAGTPSAIAVDLSHVYWTTNVNSTATANGNAVEMSGLDGSSVVTLWGFYPCLGVTVTGGDAYVTSRAPDRVVQEAPGVNNLVANTVQPRAIATNGTDLFWTSDSGAIYEQPVSFSSYTATEIASGLSQPVAIAADSKSVVWVDKSAGTVSEYDLATHTTTTLATGQALPISVALDSSYVYWATQGNASVEATIMKVAR